MAPIILTADLFFCRAAPFARGARTFRLYLYFIYFLFCSVCLFSSSPLFLRGSFYTVLPAHIHKKLRKHAQQAKAQRGRRPKPSDVAYFKPPSRGFLFLLSISHSPSPCPCHSPPEQQNAIRNKTPKCQARQISIENHRERSAAKQDMLSQGFVIRV